MIWINRILNFIASLSAAVGVASIAGQVPPKLAPYATALAVAGTLAAKYSKTPSQAMAAAEPTPKGS